MQKINKSILIMGRICSGKSTLAAAISKELGIPIASFGAYLANYSKTNNIEIIHRNTLQDLGNEFIRKDPKKFLLDVIAFSTNNFKEIIFEGVRHKIILSEIKKISKSTFSIFVDVGQEERYKRMVQRGTDIDRVKNFDDFLKLDNHAVEAEIDSLKFSSNLVIGHSYNLPEIIRTLPI